MTLLRRSIDIVVKSSKRCNLRCRYCYEYESLADRTRMSREQLVTMYEHLAGYFDARDARDRAETTIGFIWHGGEPLLLPPSYYRETFQDQRDVFGARPIKNIVQTNLTVLDEDRLDLLANGFDVVGVSLDVFGGLRVNGAGVDQQPRVLQNIEVLKANQVPFSVIVVMTRRNLDRIAQIHEIFSKAGIPLRVLPLFDGAFADQHRAYEIGTEDIIQGFRTLFDCWLASERRAALVPTSEHASLVLRHMLGHKGRPAYDRRAWLPVLLVNTNGDCYCYGDPYEEPAWCLGNLFTSRFEAILESPAFQRSADAADARIRENCTSCEYFGTCNGYPIAEEHYNCNEATSESKRVCAVEKNLFRYIEGRLREYEHVTASGSVAAEASP
jgi:uncharacterized protein